MCFPSIVTGASPISTPLSLLVLYVGYSARSLRMFWSPAFLLAVPAITCEVFGTPYLRLLSSWKEVCVRPSCATASFVSRLACSLLSISGNVVQPLYSRWWADGMFHLRTEEGWRKVISIGLTHYCAVEVHAAYLNVNWIILNGTVGSVGIDINNLPRDFFFSALGC